MAPKAAMSKGKNTTPVLVAVLLVVNIVSVVQDKGQVDVIVGSHNTKPKKPKL